MEGKVAGPAIGLIVLGFIGALSASAGLALGLIDPEMVKEFLEPFLGNLPEEARAQSDIDASLERMFSAAGAALNLVTLGLNVFVVWAGFRMMALKSWLPAVIASVLVMIACVIQCCCCPVGIAIGIWSLIVLFNKDVKQAFDAKAAA